MLADLALFGYFPTMDLNDTITAALQERGLSAARASRLAVGNPSAIKNIRLGQSPTIDRVEKLCAVLGLECYVGPPRGRIAPTAPYDATEQSEATGILSEMSTQIEAARDNLTRLEAAQAELEALRTTPSPNNAEITYDAAILGEIIRIVFDFPSCPAKRAIRKLPGDELAALILDSCRTHMADPEGDLDDIVAGIFGKATAGA